MNYTSFDGCTLIDNHQGRDGCQVGKSDYTLTVAPGEAKLIMIETEINGYSMSGSRSSEFK